MFDNVFHTRINIDFQDLGMYFRRKTKSHETTTIPNSQLILNYISVRVSVCYKFIEDGQLVYSTAL